MRKALVLVGFTAALTLSLGVAGAGPAHADANPVDLATAASFAVLAASTVTNTGPSVIDGDVGLAPGTAVVGFPPGVLLGDLHVADAVAVQAQADANAAFVSASTQPGIPGPAVSVVPALGGLTLTPDLYQSTGTLEITGNLTLDAEGDPDAIFVFRSLSSFITASASSVTLINGADACNVYWIVPTSATLGATSTLAGTVLAQTSVTATTGAAVDGRLIALTGAVTLDSNVITAAVCAVPPVVVVPGAPAAPGTPAAALPAAGPHDVLVTSSLAGVLLAAGLAGLIAVGRVRRSAAQG